MNLRQKRSIVALVTFSVVCMLALSIKSEIHTYKNIISGPSRPFGRGYIRVEDINPRKQQSEGNQHTNHHTNQHTNHHTNQHTNHHTNYIFVPSNIVKLFDAILLVSGEVTLIEFPVAGYHSFNITVMNFNPASKQPLEITLHSNRIFRWKDMSKLEVVISTYVFRGDKITVGIKGQTYVGVAIDKSI